MKATVTARDDIQTQIKYVRRQLSRDTLKDLKKVSKEYNLTEDSVIWLIFDVYNTGYVRSHAYNDCPNFVIDDGLVEPNYKLGEMLAYMPWMMTAKAKEIVGMYK